jgi:hypothetical protein
VYLNALDASYIHEDMSALLVCASGPHFWSAPDFKCLDSLHAEAAGCICSFFLLVLFCLWYVLGILAWRSQNALARKTAAQPASYRCSVLQSHVTSHTQDSPQVAMQNQKGIRRYGVVRDGRHDRVWHAAGYG